MVYIPTCNFYVGDGTNRTGGSNSHFFDAADAADPRDPVLITSTQPYISYVSDGTGTAGDITWVNESTYAGNLPAVRTQLGASYPTGYNAFYIMKYEISQGQYKEFLNTLTRTQQNNRTASQTANYFVMSATTSVSYRNGIRAPASIPSGAITFGCDFTSGTFNQSDDGEWIACNYLSWMDVAAYADWAGLRPFTELEFEKAGRGGQTVVASEYAWGSTSITQATGITNSGYNNEVSSNAANCVYGSHASVQGPLRCGSLTDSDDTRAEAGAGYYGIMELSGNLWERPVSVMDSQTGTTVSDFTGSHGDGSLSSTGFATNTDWPGTDAQGAGFRGGNWLDGATLARVSVRYYAANAYTSRSSSYGGRCARTSP
jgi:formylglycine-generating enzyme required for sulfatase activity